ncbi:hypothetical protein [Parapusillimonas granuli]|uniref:Uncharacterized protein n=1 Tax=Parapusillimonas granuli TaxID=380911 RepID=A0A853GB07_9BURK|nr:hypothetical protein [Parapusillimonas granuli]MBB5216702.1 hypothetical protein [Parapusillimonas granuli]MEB2400031.1 hypothetical protein [Alcaligenaceae bacterium]NYT51761.1 hypothetical protein [Parapusillimonas granuli]
MRFSLSLLANNNRTASGETKSKGLPEAFLWRRHDSAGPRFCFKHGFKYAPQAPVFIDAFTDPPGMEKSHVFQWLTCLDPQKIAKIHLSGACTPRRIPG